MLNIVQPSHDCVHHAPSRVNIILDRTLKYSRIQRLNLDKSVADIIRQSPSNSQINVFYMNADGSEPKTVLSVCRPDDVDAMTGDPDEGHYRVQRYVIDAIRKIVDLPLGSATRSPIVETLDTLSRERLVSADNGGNTFYIFSNMVQNSLNGSLLSCTTVDNLRLPSLSAYVSDVSQFYRDTPFNVYELIGDSEVRDAPERQCVRLFWEHVLPELKSWQPL